MKKLVAGILLGAAMMGMFMNSKVVELEQEMYAKQIEMNRLGNEVASLKLTVNDLRIENAQLYELTKWTSLGDFKITFYWIGEDEWGDTIARPCDSKHKAIEGHTIAVDPTIIPYGTEVKIDGQVYIAEDCGSAVKGKVIDIYVEEPRQEMYHTEVLIKEK